MLQIVPFGFRKILKWIKENFQNPNIFITECGFADDGKLEDVDRIQNTTVILIFRSIEIVNIFIILGLSLCIARRHRKRWCKCVWIYPVESS